MKIHKKQFGGGGGGQVGGRVWGVSLDVNEELKFCETFVIIKKKNGGSGRVGGQGAFGLVSLVYKKKKFKGNNS